MEHYQRIGLICTEDLYAVFGRHIPLLEQAILNFMRTKVSGYESGAFDLRKYANGAYALVLESDDPVTVCGTFEDHQMSLEGASLLANISAYAMILDLVHHKGDEAAAHLFHCQYYTLLDAVCGRTSFVYDPNVQDLKRNPTADEVATFKTAGPHKDREEICRFLD